MVKLDDGARNQVCSDTEGELDFREATDVQIFGVDIVLEQASEVQFKCGGVDERCRVCGADVQVRGGEGGGVK